VTHKDFKAYVELCKTRGLSEHQIAAMLGCGVNSVTRWKQYAPPHYIGLAIAALEERLEPWKNK
jgi:DNA-directed RNA polymerase specialized sigma24 family protein